MSRVTVSVIVNCYNGARYLRTALDSVYSQTFTDWEIVFWDNLSTDGSDSIAQGYDSRLRYFRGQNFLPLGTARNAAIEYAQGEYIAFLDVDDVWLPVKLEKQIPLFSSSRVGLVYSNCFLIDEKGEEFGDYFEGHAPSRGSALMPLLHSNFIAMSAAIVRKTVLDDVGLFDATLNLAEDHELFLRVATRYDIDFVPERLALYRLHSGNWHHDFGSHYEESAAIYRRFLEGTEYSQIIPRDQLRRALFGVYLKWALREVFERRNVNGALIQLSKGFKSAGNPLRFAVYFASSCTSLIKATGLKLRQRRHLKRFS